jgi:ubiquitin-like domain-containing CTD phosphatase 1
MYNESNTIMLDDLKRNYIMNKQNGLVIRPFRKAAQNRATDRELVHLKFYLRSIARLDDLSQLEHRRWERYLAKHQSQDERERMQVDEADP